MSEMKKEKAVIVYTVAFAVEAGDLLESDNSVGDALDAFRGVGAIEVLKTEAFQVGVCDTGDALAEALSLVRGSKKP